LGQKVSQKYFSGQISFFQTKIKVLLIILKIKNNYDTASESGHDGVWKPYLAKNNLINYLVKLIYHENHRKILRKKLGLSLLWLP